MKFASPPEFALRGLRMALGVAICLAIGFLAIDYQFIGETRLLDSECMLDLNNSIVGALHTDGSFSLSRHGLDT